MNEVEAIRRHLSRYQAVLCQQIERLYNALEELQRASLLLFSLHAETDDETINAWLRAEGFAVDPDGFFQSQPLLAAFREGAAPPEAISVSWGRNLLDDPVARKRLFAHRAMGPHLKHIHDRLGDVGWIYYQDASNVALQFPFIDQAKAIPWDFDWTGYHTYVSVCPANNPERRIRWTPPTIDYAGEGLILSVSIPVWQDDAFLGLWSIDLPLRYLYRDFAGSKAFPDQEQWITDQQGLLLLHDRLTAEIDQSRGHVALHPLRDLGGEWAELDWPATLAQDAGELRIKDANGVPWLVFHTRVPEVEWRLFCGLPESSMEEAAALRLSKAFQQVADGNFSHRVTATSSNALIAALVDEFNKMSQRLDQAEQERERVEAQLRQAQKMEAVGRLAGGVAHDYNNMTNVIMGYAELALEVVDARSPLHGDLLQIQEAARRSMEITRQLLAFARCQAIAPRVLDLNQTVEGMLKMLRRLIGEDVELIWRPGETVWPVKLDPSQTDQILANLCVNARDAIDGVGAIMIETSNTVFDADYCALHQGFVPGEYAQLAVSDDGCGMEAHTLNKIFEPFFSTKALGKGTGLGLATVYGIVKQNNGFINVYSEPGKGTALRLYFPRAVGETVEAPTETLPSAPLRGQGQTVLLVEDEIAILNLAKRMLEQLGYDVLAANTPSKAVEIARRHHGAVDLLITDVIMPELNGRDLAARISALFPTVKILYMSGYTANVIIHRGVLDKDVHLIQKPFSTKEFAAKVDMVLRSAQST